jgi:hypothetical protein
MAPAGWKKRIEVAGRGSTQDFKNRETNLAARQAASMDAAAMGETTPIQSRMEEQ